MVSVYIFNLNPPAACFESCHILITRKKHDSLSMLFLPGSFIKVFVLVQ